MRKKEIYHIATADPELIKLLEKGIADGKIKTVSKKTSPIGDLLNKKS